VEEKGSQFGGYSMVRKRDFADSTHFELHHKGMEVGSMSVIHYKQHTGDIIYPNDPDKREGRWDIATREPDEASWKGHDETWATNTAIAEGHRHPSISEVQIPLFKQTVRRQNNDIFLMSMARKHRAMAGTMLGVANNDALAQTGIGLSPSSNLSQHSHRLVTKLGARGVLNKAQVPDQPMNDITWEEPRPARGASAFDAADYHPIPHAEMEAGRQTVRNMIRPKRHRPDPNQGTLF
jgi:hypothetical protein